MSGEAGMHTVDILEQALHLIGEMGYSIRQDRMAGAGGGCELKNKKFFFLDLDLGPEDQLEQAIDALRREPRAAQLDMPRELRNMLQV